MKTIRFAFLLFVMLLCGCYGSVCPVVVHAAVSAQTKVSEGFRCVQQITHISESVPMPTEVRKRLDEEAARAISILSEINTVLASSIKMCNEPNLDSKFAAFNGSWSAIKKILSLFSESAGYSEYVGNGDVSLGSAPVSTKVEDPFFYTEE